jgi:hypothetical protein
MVRTHQPGEAVFRSILPEESPTEYRRLPKIIAEHANTIKVLP